MQHHTQQGFVKQPTAAGHTLCRRFAVCVHVERLLIGHSIKGGPRVQHVSDAHWLCLLHEIEKEVVVQGGVEFRWLVIEGSKCPPGGGQMLTDAANYCKLLQTTAATCAVECVAECAVEYAGKSHTVGANHTRVTKHTQHLCHCCSSNPLYQMRISWVYTCPQYTHHTLVIPLAVTSPRAVVLSALQYAGTSTALGMRP